MNKPILLIDMDGCTANYYGRFLEEWRRLYPDRPSFEEHELKTFYIEDTYSLEFANDITRITRSKDFFRTIRPMEGAVEVLQGILAKGDFEPFLCTAPEVDAVDQCCFTEKAQWVDHYLGREWTKRLIISKDKTLIHGHYLIDDKPVITGVRQNPYWRRIVFDHVYNREVKDLRMIDWSSWDKISQHLLDFHHKGNSFTNFTMQPPMVRAG